MGKIENDELRKIRNEHFIRAFEYVAKLKRMNQTTLAAAIGSKSSYISNFRTGIRPVPDETIEALVRESAQIPGQQIYTEYLYGNSDTMLLANVTDEEMAEVEMRKSDPDYDVKQQKLKAAEQNLAQQLSEATAIIQPQTIDPSSAVNASIAAYVKLVNALEAQLKAKDEELKSRLADKDTQIADLRALIKEKDARIVSLQRELLASKSSDMSNYPFTMGAAEPITEHTNI